RYLLLISLNDTATTLLYTLSLHDALPIYLRRRHLQDEQGRDPDEQRHERQKPAEGRQLQGHRLQHRGEADEREEPVDMIDDGGEIGRAHVELQSQSNLVCRLLLEKKKTTK